ncbi:hypothetical protein HQ560_01370, partial [bacterium]|nr:hypothetical protein [bacterium]
MRSRHLLPALIATLALGILTTQSAAAPVTGRYVRVTIPGSGKTLSLAEVQVFSGGKNVAEKKKTIQDSVGSDGVSARAVDGSTDGDWAKGSITHTVEGVSDPSWEVDLGKDYPIEKISVYNRMGFEHRLNGANILVLDKKRKAVWGQALPKPGMKTDLITSLKPNSPLVGKNLVAVKANSPKAPKRRGRKPAPPPTPLPPAPEWVKNGGMPKESESGFYHGSKTKAVPTCTPTSIKLAVEDLIATFGDKYPKGKDYLKRLEAIDAKDSGALAALQREALLANPVLDFDKLLVIRRKGRRALVNNWKTISNMGKTGYDNEIMILDGLDNGKLKSVYKPDGGKAVLHVDLHFDGKKCLFSSVGANGAWAVFEINVDGSGLRQVSPDMGKDVDAFDACYTPSGKIVFNSSSGYTGVPCVGGNDYAGNLHVMDGDGKNIRRVCFEQDSDWHPTMLPNGRVMYLRWEYTDSAHYFSRVLMS